MYHFIYVKYILHYIQVIMPKWLRGGLSCYSDSTSLHFLNDLNARLDFFFQSCIKNDLNTWLWLMQAEMRYFVHSNLKVFLLF